ncbi:MAG: ROK family protein [Clostridia bacterium]
MGRIDGINLNKAKKRNTISLMEILYKYAPIYRNQIADMMGLSLPTITTNIVKLINAGVVQEAFEGAHEKEGRVGRRARAVDLVSGYRYFIGVEIAPNRCTFCLSDLRFTDTVLLEEYRINIDYDETLDYVAKTIAQLLKKRPDVRERIAGIGVGIPGFVEGKSGVVRSMSRFHWRNKPLRDDLAKRTGLPVCIENNVRVRAIGEDLFNGRIRPETFVYLFVSLGIACPLIIKNSLYAGRSAGAGEIGHMIMQLDGPKCDVCGNHGCLDALASETAVLNSCQKALDEGDAPLLQSAVKESGRLTMREVCLAQSQGDEKVCEIVGLAVRYLAIALANMANFISPNLVIVDAYTMKAKENRELLLQVVKQYLFGLNDKEVAIEFKDYDRYAGCKGAAAYAIREFFIRES